MLESWSGAEEKGDEEFLVLIVAHRSDLVWVGPTGMIWIRAVLIRETDGRPPYLLN
jgi:hypothetical protein